MVVASGGCATKQEEFTSRTITSDQIQAVVESKTWPIYLLHKGEEIFIATNKKIRINDRDEYVVHMVITDLGTSKIKGNLIDQNGNDKDLADISVEVKLEDIDTISLRRPKLRPTKSPGNEVWLFLELIGIILLETL